MPETLCLIVTRSCNIECTYCPVGKADVHMDAGLARAAVRGFARDGRLVRLTGGEPTTRWDVVRAVLDEVGAQRRAGRGLEAELCTNGTGLVGDRIELLDRPWIRVVVSLDGTPAAQRASGRPWLPELGRLLELPGFTVTQTVAPEQAASVLDNFLFLWEAGVRRLSFLPVYYRPWTGRQLRELDEGLQAASAFLAPRVRSGEAEVRNLVRSGAVPLFNDDVTLDADGTWYRTNMVLADSITHPLLATLRGTGPLNVPDVPEDLRARIEGQLPAAVRRSNRAVDRVLERFVESLCRERRREPRARSRGRRPERLELHISYACTNSCRFCSEAHRLETWRDHPVGAMEVHRAILSHARAGGTHVNLTGGEPTLHPAFIHALELAREHGMRTFVGTNGARLQDPAFAARAMGSIDELSLSVHGSTPRIHDGLTGVKGSFEALMRTRDNASRYGRGIELFVNCVVTRLNVDDLPGVVDLCARLEVSTLIVSNVAPEGRALDHYDELAVPLPSWRERVPELARRAGRSRVGIRFFGLPLCALGEARMKSNDLHWDPRVTVERARGPHGSVRLSTVRALRPRRGRRYSRRCRGCRMRQVCGGMFAEYLDRFGDEGIEAIRD